MEGCCGGTILRGLRSFTWSAARTRRGHAAILTHKLKQGVAVERNYNFPDQCRYVPEMLG